MKRLIDNRASRLVNRTVLNFYGINLNQRKDLAYLDNITVYGIKQAMIVSVTHRYPDAADWIVDLLVNCVLKYVMHLEMEIVQAETKEDAQLLLWGNVVKAIREFSATKFADSSLPTETVVTIIVDEILIGLEKLIMRPAVILPD